MKQNTNTYVMNLEGAYLYKAQYKNTEFVTTFMDKAKLFTATMPYSLETIRANENEFYIEDNKQYTKLFINVNFDKNYSVNDDKEIGVIATKKTIRKHLYVNGFRVDNVEYCFYKRGASKAKNGCDIFIKKDMYEVLTDRSNLGLKFKHNEKMDMTSIYAYQALIMSGLEFTINIKPDEILIIDDINGKKFNSIASVTEQINGKLETNTKPIELQNCVTDGQGLLDESVFEEYDKTDKGFMLLRSDWMKCCAFNTRLREYWKSLGITEIEEKLNGIPTGRVLKCHKIKLVITPNSLKWLKLEYKFKRFRKNSLKNCYLHWLENIDNIFGVVKCDKEGNFGTSNRTTYQLLNSLPLSKEEVYELAKDEINYVMSLKNDFAVFRNHVSPDSRTAIDFPSDIDNVVNYHEDNVLVEDKYKTLDMINSLLLVNSDFRFTDRFKDWKKEQIDYYVENLRHGKLRLKNTIYATLFSNPFSMLQATVDKYVEGECTQEGREIWCRYYQDGQELCGFRNPNINSGNIMHLTNKYHDEYDWFNLSDWVVIINANDNDILDRAQGCDVDSDNFLLLPHPLLTKKSKECEENYPTPINRVKGDKKQRRNNNLVLARLDITLSNNFIGKIINKSQIINSYLWDCKAKGLEQGLLDKLYETSSKLSSLSQIEIDKSKKSFDNIKMAKELMLINNIEYNGKPIIEFEEVETEEKKKNGEPRFVKKMVVPNFFKFVAEDNTHRVFRDGGFKCPMDYLQEILDEKIKKPNTTDKVKFKDLLVHQKNLEGTSSNTKQLADIYEIVKKCGKKLNGLKVDTCTLNKTGKDTVKRNAKNEAIEGLSKLKISDKTILVVLRQAFKVTEDKFGFSKYARITLNLLYYSHQFKTLNCFVKKTDSDEILVKDNSGDIDIFGVKYLRTTRKEIEDVKIAQ